MEILRNIPTVPTGIEQEITTPTGASVLAASVDSWEVSPPPFVPVSIGYGAGSRILQRPNLLRFIIGTAEGNSQWERDECVEIRTLLDDMDPRLWPDVSGMILESGAVDCYASPCTGRKGRPAQEMTVLCPSSALNDVTECIFRNTTTLGVRIERLERAVLPRDFDYVKTAFGTIRVKRAYFRGELLRAEPEYEDCAAAARSCGVPVRDVINAARCAAGEDRGEQ
jgi:uncharacterized protein (DUF111 family)